MIDFFLFSDGNFVEKRCGLLSLLSSAKENTLLKYVIFVNCFSRGRICFFHPPTHKGCLLCARFLLPNGKIAACFWTRALSSIFYTFCSSLNVFLPTTKNRRKKRKQAPFGSIFELKRSSRIFLAKKLYSFITFFCLLFPQIFYTCYT